jgi:hypothetical protein
MPPTLQTCCWSTNDASRNSPIRAPSAIVCCRAQTTKRARGGVILKAADAPGALAAIIAGVAEGIVSPTEAASMANLVDRWRAAFETSEIDRRLTDLEDKLA